MKTVSLLAAGAALLALAACNETAYGDRYYYGDRGYRYGDRGSYDGGLFGGSGLFGSSGLYDNGTSYDRNRHASDQQRRRAAPESPPTASERAEQLKDRLPPDKLPARVYGPGGAPGGVDMNH